MDRRAFLRTTALTSVAAASFARLPNVWAGSTADNRWRAFEVTTRVEILEPLGRDPRLGAPASRRGHRLPQDPRAHLERRTRQRTRRSAIPATARASSSPSGPPDTRAGRSRW